MRAHEFGTCDDERHCFPFEPGARLRSPGCGGARATPNHFRPGRTLSVLQKPLDDASLVGQKTVALAAIDCGAGIAGQTPPWRPPMSADQTVLGRRRLLVLVGAAAAYPA